MAHSSIMDRLYTTYRAQLRTPRARAEWLLRLLQTEARAMKSRDAYRRWPTARLQLEFSAFIRGTGEGTIEAANVLIPKDTMKDLLGETRHHFLELRDGGVETVIGGRWAADMQLQGRTGRIEIRPLPLGLDAASAFWWQVAETLRAPGVRIAFCRNATCRAPFVARKAQRYCRTDCAPSGAERNRVYRERHRLALNRARMRRYDAARRAEHGERVRIVGRAAR